MCSSLFIAQYSGHVEKYKCNDFEKALKRCCHFIYYLVVFLGEMYEFTPCWEK